MNNNLIIFYKDKSKDVLSFSLDTDEQSALKKFEEIRPDVNKKDIVKYFYMKEDEIPADTYGNYCELSENKKMKMNVRRLLIDKRVEEIRKQRDGVIAGLDMPFMKSLEGGQDSVKNHIIVLKEFLRDLPQNLKLHLLETDEEIIRYNPFGNIFEVILIRSGKGYERPPKVTIDASANGSEARAIAFTRDGEISKIEIIDHGNGYNFVPKVTIEDSAEGKKSYAICGVPQNCFLTEQQILINTRQRYLVL